jgi:hypothetical protein
MASQGKRWTGLLFLEMHYSYANDNIDYYEGRADADLTSWLEYYIASQVHSCNVSLNEMVAYIASTPEKSRRKRKKS